MQTRASETLLRLAFLLCGTIGGTTLGLVALDPRRAAAANVTLLETGSSLLYPLFNLWVPKYTAMHPGLRITTQSTGSGTGIAQAISGVAQIGASDAYMSYAQVKKNPDMLNIPLAISAQTVNYNVPGLNDKGLKLSGPVLAGIYGGIAKWNDPEIAKLNPGVSLPDHGIPRSTAPTAAAIPSSSPNTSPFWRRFGQRPGLRHDRLLAARAGRHRGPRQPGDGPGLRPDALFDRLSASASTPRSPRPASARRRCRTVTATSSSPTDNRRRRRRWLEDDPAQRTHQPDLRAGRQLYRSSTTNCDRELEAAEPGNRRGGARLPHLGGRSFGRHARNSSTWCSSCR